MTSKQGPQTARGLGLEGLKSLEVCWPAGEDSFQIIPRRRALGHERSHIPGRAHHLKAKSPGAGEEHGPDSCF